MDKIIIKSLEIFAHHGVYDEEKDKGQRFVINAELSLATAFAGQSDNIDDTLDYGKVCEFIKDYMVRNQFNLLEKLTNDLARKLLLRFTAIQSLKLEISKPEAPIPMKFEYVSIQVKRSRHTSFISIGSNMGDREDYLKCAIENLDADECIDVIKVSKFLETKPYGMLDQDDFLNAVFEISTLYSPEELLERLHLEEQNAQRERTIHWGPRTLDLDIIYFDNIIMSTDNLIVPHPDMCNRLFVLEPLCEIAPHFVHPRFMLTSKELLNKLNSQK